MYVSQDFDNLVKVNCSLVRKDFGKMVPTALDIAHMDAENLLAQTEVLDDIIDLFARIFQPGCDCSEAESRP